MTDLVATIKAEMKAAMKARDKPRLGTIRLIQAEFKRIEVDERIDIDDARALTVLDKMVKQRRDSATQYRDANREELAAQEDLEIAVIQEFLPEQLGEAEIAQAIDEALAGHCDIVQIILNGDGNIAGFKFVCIDLDCSCATFFILGAAPYESMGGGISMFQKAKQNTRLL